MAMFPRIPKIVLLFILILVFGLLNFQIFAEDSTTSATSTATSIVEEMSPKEERQALEEELEKLEEQIAQYDKDITKTQKEKKTLQNQIYILKKKIEKSNLQIYQSNVIIEDLGIQIVDTEDSIEKTASELNKSKQKLADILRVIYKEDQRSFIEILLSENKLSDFFAHLVALETLNLKNQELLENVESLKDFLEGEKESLDEEREDLERTVKIQTLQKQESAAIKKDQEYFLKLTEAEYQKYLKEKEVIEKKATEIRTRLFELIGVAEGGIEFGKAVEIAKYVEDITKVRSAFLLAVIAQESMRYGKFGGNVGQCYLKNRSTGEGIIINSGKIVSRVMKPMGLSGRKGDIDDFWKTTKELGRDPYSTPVSCPWISGWGGAMGPAQFIPTTWVLYKNRVSIIIGKLADPWNIKDSFIASGLYLADLGASKQTYNAEWAAAMRYFSGTAKRTRYNGYGFYGDSVMSRSEGYQKEIDLLAKAK